MKWLLDVLGLGKLQAIAVGALLLLLVAAVGAIWWIHGQWEASIRREEMWESNALIAEARLYLPTKGTP